MSYQIGVTEANMQDLEDLYLPDPLWDPLSDFSLFSGARTTGSGQVVGTGRPNFTWRFNLLSIAQVGTLLYYVSEAGVLKASRVVYVQTRIPSPNMTDRVFQSYRATMLLPAEPRDMQYSLNQRYENVTIRFVQAVEL